MKLNEFQEAAANHLDGRCLVVSVPGSGKTAMLVERTARLIEQGVAAKSIVCMTFTNKAADEMSHRIAKRLGQKTPGMYVGTFHALCAMLLRKFGKEIGLSPRFTILDSNDQKDLIAQVARRLEIVLDRPALGHVMKSVNDFRENVGDRNALEMKLQDENKMAVADEYLSHLRGSQLVDFSGLLSETIRLINESQTVREKIQEAFRYLQVDEFQDSNKAQFALINLFSAKWGNVLGVGDISQSIFRFRGARYENVRDFINTHEGCKVLQLSLNYRSTPEIIKHADTLIRHNTSHMADRFETENDAGVAPSCLRFGNQIEEADWIAKHISRLVSQGGWDYSDVAVLYRMNAMAEPIERALTTQGIQYVVIGGKSFYDRREIRDSIAMLRFHVNRRDGIAFHRIAAIIKGLGDITVGKIENIALETGCDLLEAFRLLSSTTSLSGVKDAYRRFETIFSGISDIEPPAIVLRTIVDELGYMDWLESNYKDTWADRQGNVSSMVDAAAEYADRGSDATEQYLQDVSLITASDKKTDGSQVSLMTLHAAKGAEFPVVIIIGVEDGILPHAATLAEDKEEGGTEGLEEERRLCYVGITRAEQLLYVTYCQRRKRFGRNGAYFQRCTPSQFLFESGLLNNKEREKIGYVGEGASYTGF